MYFIVEDLSTWNFFILAWKELAFFFKKQVSLHELTSWKHETLKQVSICNEYDKIPGWWTFFSFPNGFSNLSNSRFRSLIGWIQAIKLRKREFDRLEKIWQFYQPSSCLSKKKRLFYLILRGKTLFFLFFFKKNKQKRSKSTRQTHFLKMSQTSFI